MKNKIYIITIQLLLLFAQPIFSGSMYQQATYLQNNQTRPYNYQQPIINNNQAIPINPNPNQISNTSFQKQQVNNQFNATTFFNEEKHLRDKKKGMNEYLDLQNVILDLLGS